MSDNDAIRAHQLWRLDDNGNEFLVGTFDDPADAQALRDKLAAGGHRQTYWIVTVAERVTD